MRKIRLKKQKKSLNKKFLFLSLALTALGLIAVADASAPAAISSFSDKFYFAKQQTVWGVIGVLLLFLVSRIHYSFWEKLALPLFALSIVVLIVVLIPGVGSKALGARRWVFLGPVSVQPSELVKLSLAVYLAKVASKQMRLLSYFLPLALIAGLIMLQPDLGTTLVIVSAGLAQIYISGVSFGYIAASVIIGAVASLLVILTSDYRRARLFTFLNQARDPLGEGYHIKQVLYALGAGGLAGVGLGQSRQKYLFLPEATTDSIFAIIAEEVGFIGASLVIFLFALYVFWGVKIVKNAPDKFSQVLAMGLIAWIGGQAFLNIGSMLALVPLTGIPLPFFSYGGSSLIMVLTATGILLNISKYVSTAK